MLNELFRPKLIIGTLPATLANGTTADATQVMSDLNYIVNQVNANAAPLASPTFTGTVTTAALSATNITASGTINVTGAPLGSLLPPVYDRVVRSAGNISTSSTSTVDVTGAAITFTTKARPVQVGCAVSMNNNTINGDTYVVLNIDGVLELGAASGGLYSVQQVAGKMYNGSFTHQTAALTAAAHTIKLQWNVGVGTGIISATTSSMFSYWANEL